MQRHSAHATIKPLLPPKKFLPQPYEAAGGIEPFSVQKLSVAIKQEAAQPNSLLTAEMNRRREPLEAYPLDSMSMVGSMTRDNQRYALLRVDNLLYQVKGGDYLGQNFGRIMKISETDVTLREVVQDAAGRVDRTHKYPPASGEGSMKNAAKQQERSRMMTHWRATWMLAAGLALGLGSATQAFAQPSIRSINSTQQAGVEVVRIEMSEPLKELPQRLHHPDAAPAWRSTCPASSTASAVR